MLELLYVFDLFSKWPLKLSDIHVVHFYGFFLYTSYGQNAYFVLQTFNKLTHDTFEIIFIYFKCILYLQ